MAIDTVAKRSSVQAYTLGLTRPPPDDDMTAGDRAHAAWFYSGLTYTPAAAIQAASMAATFIWSLFKRKNR